MHAYLKNGPVHACRTRGAKPKFPGLSLAGFLGGANDVPSVDVTEARNQPLQQTGAG